MASEPQALLQPDAATRIQDALTKHGYLSHDRSGDLDRRTSAALRKFQEDHHLAGTGAPDHETLRQLGLDPRRIFKKNPGAQRASG